MCFTLHVYCLLSAYVNQAVLINGNDDDGGGGGGASYYFFAYWKQQEGKELFSGSLLLLAVMSLCIKSSKKVDRLPSWNVRMCTEHCVMAASSIRSLGSITRRDGDIGWLSLVGSRQTPDRDCCFSAFCYWHRQHEEKWQSAELRPLVPTVSKL